MVLLLTMVFAFRHVENGMTLLLGDNNLYTLGRSRRNLIHLTDETVNNSHATLKIDDGIATLEDLNSDFGTWVNSQKLKEPFRLKNGDVIVFGKKCCKFVFLDPKFEAIIDKKVFAATQYLLGETLKEVNITLSHTYSQKCSHYIVESVSLDTLKEKNILYFLIDGKTVITPKYFMNIRTYIKEAPLIPNIYRYMPDIDNFLKEKGIEEIYPKKKRRHMFDNMFFIFFDRNCDRELTELILKCGGDSLLYSDRSSAIKEVCDKKNTSDYIAVNHQSGGQRPLILLSFVKAVHEKKKQLAVIQADDIYISILKGSMVGVEKTLLASKELQSRTSAKFNEESTILDVSDDDNDDETTQSDESGNIVEYIIKTKRPSAKQKEFQPPNTFSRFAATYKQHNMAIREMVLDNSTTSSTIANWLTKANSISSSPKSPIRKNHQQQKSSEINKHKISFEDESVLRDSDKTGTKMSFREKQEVADQDVAKNSISVTGERKNGHKRKIKSTVNGKLNGDISGDSVKKDSKHRSSKRSSLVFNPLSINGTPKNKKGTDRLNSSNLEKWLNKYGQVEIKPI